MKMTVKVTVFLTASKLTRRPMSVFFCGGYPATDVYRALADLFSVLDQINSPIPFWQCRGLVYAAGRLYHTTCCAVVGSVELPH
jgi:hypothetical protein